MRLLYQVIRCFKSESGMEGPMTRILIIFLAVFSIFTTCPVCGASEQALKLRTLNGLSEFTPSEAFLNSNFVAEEIEPQYVFGKVKDFWKARACPTGWFIEQGEKPGEDNQKLSTPAEFTLYLEEDCPGKVSYYVFIDHSRSDSAQWMEWRKLFHKSKAEQQYGATCSLLDKAASKGFPVNAELRFIQIQGDLISKKPENFLMDDLKVTPVCDLKKSDQ